MLFVCFLLSLLGFLLEGVKFNSDRILLYVKFVLLGFLTFQINEEEVAITCSSLKNRI